MTSDNIVVTGFGPFINHKVNASWEAVKLLPKYKFDSANLIIKEIPVTYQDVDKEVPLLWKNFNPKLVVHVGVSMCTQVLTIETQAFRTGYEQADCQGSIHPTGENCSAKFGSDCIQGALDLKRICETVNKGNNIKAQLSTNAGRYLCEFIYYKSLNIDNTRTMFIHVPPLNNPYSVEELADGLAQIINCALEQLQDNCENSLSVVAAENK